MRRSERYCLYALGAMYAGPTVAMVVWAWAVQAPRSIVALLLTAVLVATVIAAATRTWRLFLLVQLPLSLLALAYAAYTVKFGVPPGRTLAGILARTSWEEVWGFTKLGPGKWLAALLLLWAACYLALTLHVPKQPIFVNRANAWSRVVILALVPVAAYAVLNPIQLIDGISFNPTVGSAMFLAGDIPRARAESRGSRVNKIPYQARHTRGEEVHILVVGESVRRASWSAYGYARTTTPFLNTLKDQTVFLQNAVADANLTEWAFPILLTGITPQNLASSNIRGNLLDLAKEAGYRTAWLVNQDVDISTAVGIDADRLVSPLDFEANINGRHTLDETLLPAFREELARAGAPRFIGVHMMGSHWEYYRRYPAKFQRFGSAQELGALSMVSVLLEDKNAKSAVVDAYDNSILYSDWFLQQLIEQARRLSVPATLTFFADHGEDLQLLDGETGHGQPKYTQHAFEIPAFVWFNEAFRKAHPEIIASLARNSSKEIRSHNVFYTMAELMGIEWPGGLARKSFASDRFVPDTADPLAAGGILISPRSPATSAAE
jgi:glucan phosphoethanolaminetransferase (alkaline phosphatase superfamily)